jgi:threonine/homoserine/homoserine lactone efflux protein
MDELVALAAFSAVASGTPGPNNILLWTAGARFGFRATVPHVLGTSVGLGSLALVMAAASGALSSVLPQAALVVKVAGSIYLLYLAWRVSGIRSIEQSGVSRPLSFLQAIAFQYTNPTSWSFATGAVTTFLPTGVPGFAGAAVVAGTMMLVIVPTAVAWAAGGTALSRFFANERQRRVLGIVLAAVVAVSGVFIWV